MVLFAAGRVGSTASLKLEAAGLAADDRGRVLADQATFRTIVPHIYAVGDVIGFPSLASTSMEQGRIAACHAFGAEAHAPPEFFPYGIYSVPEISTIGMTEEQVREKRIPYETGIARFRETSRGHIMGLNSGFMKMIFDLNTRRLLGVHIVGKGATELIHIGQAVLNLDDGLDYLVFPVRAQDAMTSVPQTWQMLDYLATDYAGAVKDGAVISTSEYAEMREFTATARSRIAALPPTVATPVLLQQADALVASVNAKASPAQVATQAHALADALLQTYPVPTAPERAPDLARGATLYQNQCAACHGATGHGDGPAGLQLSTRPVNFADQTRADQRSALSLYEVISQGVEGTPMTSYAQQLSSDDRWALAYYVGSLAYTK